MEIEPYLKEVENALKRLGKASPKEIEHHKNYKNSQHEFLGLKVPPQREVFKKGFSFTKKSPEEILRIWDGIWKAANCHEVMNQPLFHYDAVRKTVDIEMAWPVLRNWVEKLENWAHSDSLSGIYAEFLEREPKRIYPTLVEWNSSRFSWKRRQSVVSLLYYYRARKKVLPFEKMLPLVKALLKDEDYYVQKGVGWTLRELYQAYPAPTRSFILKYLHEIHPHAFYATVEKFSKKEKAELSLKRRKMRSG